jgi:glycosyltransferase involved in cell wall biosynthesis
MTAKISPEPLVSIVTPAYNEEKHLAECVESVLAQTYTNWDYTIVNNCSSDATGAIAQSYADRDPRIRVVSNSTLIPAVANFNLALRLISPASKYTKMVLADDWIFPECLERMVAVMEEYPSVGIVGAYGLVQPWIMWTGLPYPSVSVSGREICRKRLLGGPYVFGSATSVLFRSDLVRSHDPFYSETSAASDSESCFELLKDCDFGFVHQVLTFSRERPNSLLEESRALNTAAHAVLHELVAYGPHYLTPDEYSERLRTLVSKYYDFLATSLLRGRDRSFSDYHREKLQEEGISFRYARLAYALAKLPFRLLLASARTLRSERLWGL